MSGFKNPLSLVIVLLISSHTSKLPHLLLSLVYITSSYFTPSSIFLFFHPFLFLSRSLIFFLSHSNSSSLHHVSISSLYLFSFSLIEHIGPRPRFRWAAFQGDPSRLLLLPHELGQPWLSQCNHRRGDYSPWRAVHHFGGQ